MRKLSKGYDERGAGMGRASCGVPTCRVRLNRVPVNRQGYDSGGAYWGVGEPLYWAWDDGGFEHFFRASNRADAKAILSKKFPGVTFLR